MRARAVVAASACLALSGCFTPAEVDTGGFRGQLDGTCGASGVGVIVQAPASGVVWLTLLDDANVEMPVNGTKPPGAPLRDGGWLLHGYHCLFGDPDGCLHAPERLRVCPAHRVGDALTIECRDGLDRPVCQATITE